MNQRAHSNASSQGFRNQYIVDSPISVSNPNSQIQVQHRSLYPPPAPISSVSNGMESNPYITSPYMPVVQRNQMT